MLLYTESQIDFGNTDLNPVKQLPSSDSWQVYRGLFKSKKFTMMFFCDTIGFFSYMIIFQVIINVNTETYFWQKKTRPPSEES